MSSCAFCGGSIGRIGSRGPARKYCSDTCGNRAKWLRQKAANPCPKCGGPMSRASSCSAENPTCRSCQKSPCGTPGSYKRGCRCVACKARRAADMRRYTAKRIASGNPIDYYGSRARADGTCESCGEAFLARLDTVARFCSLKCANDAQGRAETPRNAFKIGRRARFAIYEACDWTCQLCLSPVRPDEDSNHPRYPTLDHIVPRARGGSDDPENLRLACRQCNTRRGTNIGWTPTEVAEVDNGGFSIGYLELAV